jgi:hypothetical protein
MKGSPALATCLLGSACCKLRRQPGLEGCFSSSYVSLRNISILGFDILSCQHGTYADDVETERRLWE